MRLSCEYKVEQIPVGYHMLFVSLIKEALKKTDEEYYERLYVYDEDKSNKKAKDFCFAVYLKDFKLDGNHFKINDRVILTISSPDYEFGINLYNGLLKLPEFEYRDYLLKKLRIDLLKEKKIEQNTAIFTTLSPIFIKDINNNPLDINDEHYNQELNYIADIILNNYRGYGLKEKLEFKPLNMKKRVVKQEIKEFTENTGKPYYYVNGYVGKFQLTGVVEDLKDLYLLGIGFKRNQGFGMVEVI